MNNKTKGRFPGKLTVFLGAASGVGKTYAMLEAAHEKGAQGVDVVIGWLEKPNLNQYENLLKDIPVVPPRNRSNNGTGCLELDIAAILERKPHIVIIDNLASTNLKGARHAKRYQDVIELLESGINVYTTLSVQNVESLKDIIEKITGIEVVETVPDSLLETAELKLIDLSHDELLQRVKEGKVFLPDNLGQKTEKFFRPGNINALRELALRYTAQRIDQELNEYMQVNDIKGPWPAGERILACVSPSPFSAQVIRAAKRIAAGLKAEWFAVYVETHKSNPGSERGYSQLAKNLRLAEELGAEVITLNGEDVAAELLSLARRKNITQIIIGKPLHSRLRDLWQGSIVDNIVRNCQGISLYIIPGKNIPKEKQDPSGYQGLRPSLLFPYVLTLILVVAVTFINKMLGFDLTNIVLLYLLPVLLSAAYWGRGPSIMASLLGVLAFDVFFVPPVLSITVYDFKYLFSFAVFLLVAVTTGTMANKLRYQAEIARRREAKTSALYALSRKIVAETELDGILRTVVTVVSETIDGKAIIYIPDKTGRLCVKATNALREDKLLDVNERDVACWVFEHGKMGGHGTETWSEAAGLYYPLKIEEKNIGVLGVIANHPEGYLSTEHRQLLEAFANLTALAVLSLQLAAEAQQARYLAQSERLRTALFNSISHELRTPLASIMGAVTSLLEEGDIYNQADRRALLQSVNEGAFRMNRLVGNLLDMARLESGMMQLKNDWCDIQEIIGVALRRMHLLLQERPVRINIAPDVTLVKADSALIEQVLVNLIDNAHKYSPQDTEIKIDVSQTANEIRVAVKNMGSPIPEEDRIKIFDKFYRVNSSQHPGGTGLGLSICKGIIEAHGGTIWVDSDATGTNVFIFCLPFEKLEVPVIPPDKGVKTVEQ